MKKSFHFLCGRKQDAVVGYHSLEILPCWRKKVAEEKVVIKVLVVRFEPAQ